MSTIPIPYKMPPADSRKSKFVDSRIYIPVDSRIAKTDFKSAYIHVAREVKK
jgi:hypothetical protein